jgi:hypothetical protein
MQSGVVALFEQTETVLDTARASSLSGVTDDELHDALLVVDRIRRKAEADSVRLLGEIDTRRSYEPKGAKTAGAFAAWQLPVADDYARSLVRCSRQLRRMRHAEPAFRDGSISADHVGLLAKCEATNPDAFDDAEAMLLGLAVSMDYVDFTKAVTYWCQLADPDGSQRDAEQRMAARTATAFPASDGMVLVKAQLDPVGGAIFLETFRKLTRELFLLDWEAAKAIHGDDVSFDKLARTETQRGADALQLMAERAQMVDGTISDIHGPRPLITVLVGEKTLEQLCETEAGTILDPHEVIQLLDRAEVERIVFDGPSRVVDVGVRQRFFTGATRRAVQVRDRECDHPSCHAPVTDADIDHIFEYGLGGWTIQDNGRVYCKWHHRWRHKNDRTTKPAA